MKMIGVGIFGNAIGLLGVFNDPFDYNSIYISEIIFITILVSLI